MSKKMTYIFLKTKYCNNDYCYFNSQKCQSGYRQCATEVGLAPPVRDRSRSGTPSARLKMVWYHKCTTQICPIRSNFGLDSLIRAGLGRAPHPGISLFRGLHF